MAWQAVINTGTTVITFLMVFLIQQAQNKDGKAVELKLNESIAATRGASNRLIDVEALSEAEAGLAPRLLPGVGQAGEEGSGHDQVALSRRSWSHSRRKTSMSPGWP